MTILQQTIDLLKNRYKDYIQTLTIEEARLGVFMSAVRLSDGSYGMSSTYPDIQMKCYKKDRDFSEFTPNNIVGHKVIDLLETTKRNGIVETLKVAVLNAVSSRFLKNSEYKILHHTDPIDLIDIHAGKTITIVGAFHSYIQKIAETNSKLYVLELHEDAFNEDDIQYYVPAHQYPEVLPQSDVVLITGLTLVNNTFDDLLNAIKPGTQTIVTGPSSSFIPDVLFDNGIQIIGSVNITNPEVMMRTISEAGAGFHLFKYCAEKICILNERTGQTE